MSGRSVKRLGPGTRHRLSPSPLAQLLLQWGLVEPPADGPDLGDQLGRWMGWTDAVALSAVLAEADVPAPPVGLRAAGSNGPSGPEPSLGALRTGLAQVRESLLAAIATDPLFTQAAAGQRLVRGQPQTVEPLDFATCRRQVQAHQRAMERQLAPWRDAVRSRLAQQGPAQALLAALDGVMAQALSERTSWLLSRVPLALERRHALQHPQAFFMDVQALLRAELEFRLEPIEGMLDALASLAPAQVEPAVSAHRRAAQEVSP